MYSCYMSILVLVVTYSESTLANLYPELAFSHVAPTLLDINVKETKFVESKTSLTFLTPFTEVFEVNNTGQSLNIIRKKHHPVGLAGTVRGGVLGDDVYSYYRTRFYWNDNTTIAPIHSHKFNERCNNIEALVFYFNRKYGSYENALKQSDGILQVSAKIYVFDGAPLNYLYNAFDHVVKNIQEPGKHCFTKSSFTFVWFIFYPEHTTYYAYRGTYIDDDTKKTYPATTIALTGNAANYISYLQFKESFGTLKDECGQPLVNIAPRYPQGDVTVIQSKGVTIINLKG